MSFSRNEIFLIGVGDCKESIRPISPKFLQNIQHINRYHRDYGIKKKEFHNLLFIL